MITSRHCLVYVLILFFIQTLSAQKASEREWTIFRKGVDDYQAGKFNSAEKNFSTMISKLPNNTLLTANYLMLAKTQYKLNTYNESIKTCDYFLNTFPHSDYIDDIYALKGDNFYRQKNYEGAVQNWLTAAAMNTKISSKALNHAEKTARYKMTERQLLKMKNSALDAYHKRFYAYQLAEKYYNKGNSANALITLEEIRMEPGQVNLYNQEVNRLYNLLKNRKSDAIRIAALLPLSGEDEDVGKQVLDGVKLAVDNFNQLPGIDIELVTYDYQTRLIKAVKMFKEIALDQSILAVFGPIENDITAACAAISEYEKLPLISPTSSLSQLTELSPNVIQLATPVNTISKKFVETLADSLRKWRIATLAPIDNYFIELTDAFVNNVEEIGGKIGAREWYYPGEKSFKKQFEDLKEIGLKLSFQDSLIQMDSTVSPVLIDSMYKNYVEEKKLMMEEKGEDIDPEDVPVISFDAIFMPIYREDLSLIASQFAYYNIQAQILGNSDWYDPEALKKNKSYLNGIIFAADGYMNEEDWDFRQFRNSFRDRYKRTPEKMDIIGYDSFNYIVNVISNNKIGINRNNFIEKLVNVPKYNGIYRSVDLDYDRYNKSIRLLKYWRSVIVPLN
ncbi:MAG: ABC transporter substrate-binding protein [Calditrichaceae bacterium]|jgi:branched-chain amino acid transport system substrate-binding protein